MPEKDREKISINANPTGALEIEEFKNRMAEFRKGRRLKGHAKKK